VVESRRARKKQELRDRILETATRLVVKQGLAATTVDEIATEVDISQTTFFNYFPSKAALVEAMIGQLLDLLDAVLADVGEGDAPAVEKVRKLFELSADLKKDQHRLMRDLMVEVMRASAADERPSKSLSAMRDRYRVVLDTGQRTGEVRKDVDASTLADVVIGMYTSVVTNWVTDADYPIAKRLPAVGALAVEVVSARPPAKRPRG